MTERLYLTEVHDHSAGDRAYGQATSRNWRLLLGSLRQAGIELPRALPHDARQLLSRRAFQPMRMDTGTASSAETSRIALYVHYSANGSISEMVRRQLFFLRQGGFSVVFISMASHIPEPDWQAVRASCALVVQRRNLGLDFGAWQDVMPEVQRRWGIPDELMLVNDSILGPITPITPVLETMRSGGVGLFGLTESLQGGAHLQSYMLMTRGKAATSDLMRFVECMFISHSKWLLIQLGEIRLTRWMRRRGHKVAAVFGYDRVVQAALAYPAEWDRVIASHRYLRKLDHLSSAVGAEMLKKWPLNPTHHLWYVLVKRFGFPFLKTELVARNPGRIPGMTEWAQVVPDDAPCPVQMLQAHLLTVAPPWSVRHGNRQPRI